MSMIERCHRMVDHINADFDLDWELVRNDAGVYVLQTRNAHKRIMFPMATVMRVHKTLDALHTEMKVNAKSREYFRNI